MESKAVSQPKSGEKGSRSNSLSDAKYKPENYGININEELSADFKEVHVADEKPSRPIPSGHKVASSYNYTGDDAYLPESRSVRRDSKGVETIDDEILEADEEFLALMRKPNTGEAMISTDPDARHIASGLKM